MCKGHKKTCTGGAATFVLDSGSILCVVHVCDASKHEEKFQGYRFSSIAFHLGTSCQVPLNDLGVKALDFPMWADVWGVNFHFGDGQGSQLSNVKLRFN